MQRNKEPTSPANDMPESMSPFDPHYAATAPNGIANAFPWIKPAKKFLIDIC